MTLINILFTIAIQSAFCLGLRTLLSDGQIFHFIRSPFEFEQSKMMNFLKNRLRRRVLITTENAFEHKKKYEKLSNKISIILKPLLLCVICFSSVWGGLVFVVLNGLQPIELIICCISSAFIIKVINDKIDW